MIEHKFDFQVTIHVDENALMRDYGENWIRGFHDSCSEFGSDLKKFLEGQPLVKAATYNQTIKNEH